MTKVYIALEQFDNFLENKTIKWFKEKMSYREQRALFYYTRNGFLDVNNYLRGGGANKKILSVVSILDVIFCTYPLEENVILWRGTDLIEVEYILTNDIFYDYKSTSIIRKIAELFCWGDGRGCLIKFKVPKGKRGFYVGSYTGFENNEGEFILKRQSHYKITSYNQAYIELKIQG